MTDRTIILRANEIASMTDGRVLGRDAMTQALVDRFGDDVGALRAALAGELTKKMRDYKKTLLDLPEQPGLFDVPPVIYNETEDGPLYIKRDEASVDEVDSFMAEGERYHGSQRARFKRGRADVAKVRTLSEKEKWVDARAEALAIAASDSSHD